MSEPPGGAAGQAPAVDLDRHVLGDPGAPITVVEHGDFECPYCAAAAPVLRRLVEESGGRVRLVFRHFPVFTKHPFALTAALAAEAAGERFWPLHDLLFAHQDRLTDADLERYAAQVGSGGVTGDAAQRFRPAVEADYRAGVEAGVRGTPTLFVADALGADPLGAEPLGAGRLYTGRVELGALRTALGLTR